MTTVHDELNWMIKAFCHDAPLELFISAGDDPDAEPWYAPPEALSYCNMCPVRTECLEFATTHHEVGVWGGTTKYQRDQLTRKLERTRCPSCGCDDALVAENARQLCLGCGTSWYIF